MKGMSVAVGLPSCSQSAHTQTVLARCAQLKADRAAARGEMSG